MIQIIPVNVAAVSILILIIGVCLVVVLLAIDLIVWLAWRKRDQMVVENYREAITYLGCFIGALIAGMGLVGILAAGIFQLLWPIISK